MTRLLVNVWEREGREALSLLRVLPQVSLIPADRYSHSLNWKVPMSTPTPTPTPSVFISPKALDALVKARALYAGGALAIERVTSGSNARRWVVSVDGNPVAIFLHASAASAFYALIGG